MPWCRQDITWTLISCSICLDFLKDPVTIPCCHTFCMDCMKAFWGLARERRNFSCPQCRQTFKLMPYLAKNTVIAALIKEMTQQVGPDNHCHAQSHDVSCDNRRKWKAVEGGEVCLTSGCDNHLQDCRAAIPLKKKRLMTATAALAKRQRHLEMTRQNIQQTIWFKEKAMGVLQQEVRNINNSADKAVEGSKETFGQLFHQLEQAFSDIKRQVRSSREPKWVKSKSLWGGRSRRSLSWVGGVLHRALQPVSLWFLTVSSGNRQTQTALKSVLTVTLRTSQKQCRFLKMKSLHTWTENLHAFSQELQVYFKYAVQMYFGIVHKKWHLKSLQKPANINDI